MKKFIINFLVGILIVILMVVLEFLVTLPFGKPGEKNYAKFINYELLLTAVPVTLLTFIASWVLKTPDKRNTLWRSITWTAMVLANFLLVGILNGTALLIFSTLGIYVLLIFAFAGPYLYAAVRKLPETAEL